MSDSAQKGLIGLVVVLLVAVVFVGARASSLSGRLDDMEARLATAERSLDKQAAREGASPSGRRDRGKRGGDGVMRMGGRGGGSPDELRAGRATLSPGFARGGATTPDSSTAQPLDLENDAEARQQIENILEENREQDRQRRSEDRAQWWASTVQEQVSAYAAEADLDAPTVASVTSVLSELNTARSSIWQDRRAGDLTFEEARAEMEALREDTAGQLTELIGEDGVNALREKLPSRGGRAF